MSPYDKILALHESRLFEKDRSTIEILRSRISGSASEKSLQPILNRLPDSTKNNFHTYSVSDADSLIVQLKRKTHDREHLIFIIPQRYSWGELQVTRDIFQRILTHLNVSESLLHVAIEFGSKVNHDLPRSSTTSFVGRAHCSSSLVPDNAIKHPENHEASYIIQYVERNGRNRGDPWSLRQTGVYSQTNYSTRHSSWIFLHLAESTRSLLEDELRSLSEETESKGDPLALHALLLIATVDNWGEYVQDLSTKIRSLDEKARSLIYSTASTQNNRSSLRDMQTLQRIEQKISIACSAVTSNSKVAAGLIAQRECFCTPTSSSCEQTRRSLNSYAADMHVHQQSLRILLNLLQSTSKLFSRIIETRNVDRLQFATEESSRHLNNLKSLTQDIRDEHRNSSALAANTHSDTKSMKALTTVATALLPASLIATIFSSNLIQLQPVSDSSDQSKHFVLASQFWIYILVSIAMTGTTLGCIRALEYWWVRRSS
ncbi:hypothetical protein IQ07DRAFT_628704 [Pyrenochaeta sp. DS3sAY3a]|nr:hypothetical protein IQ07DRAFT_628704 [Pyrenochaeta sp. DS3sAY3a]